MKTFTLYFCKTDTRRQRRMLLKFIINGIVTGLLYSMLAIGFALVYNTTRIFHIAAAGIYVFAAYMFWWLASGLGLPLVVAAILAVLLSMALSWLSDKALYQPLRKKKASLNVMMIASIGLMTVIVNLLAMIFGNEARRVDNAYFEPIMLSGAVVTVPQLYQVITAVVSVSLFLILLTCTRFGLRIRALSADETLYDILGYNRQQTYSVVFLVSGLFIGLASCTTAYDVGLKPDLGMIVIVNAMVAMILGGSGRFGTCVLGGLTLGMLQALVELRFSADWKNAVAFVVLLLILFLRPQGLAGYKQRLV